MVMEYILKLVWNKVRYQASLIEVLLLLQKLNNVHFMYDAFPFSLIL